VSTWMVIEDEPDLYEMVLAMYDMMGVNGLSFVDGEEVIAWLEEVESGNYTEELPELALLDIRLPGKMDGLQVGQRIRQSQHLKAMPIILMTAYKMSPMQEQEAIETVDAAVLLYKPLPGYEQLHDLFHKVIEGG
jgi:CheY-like chemotaxis protein